MLPQPRRTGNADYVFDNPTTGLTTCSRRLLRLASTGIYGHSAGAADGMLNQPLPVSGAADRYC
jgi:hypothetical protein